MQECSLPAAGRNAGMQNEAANELNGEIAKNKERTAIEWIST
jgi:hypothetical protein